MKIAIIGAGHVGSALAKGWAKAGHRIYIGARDLSADKIQSLEKSHDHISAHTISEAAEAAEVILVATPPQAVIALAGQLGDVTEKVIIDATNALFVKPEPYSNASEALRKLTLSRHVVKCFNSTGFENMQDPIYNGQGIDMFMAGNSPRGKEKTAQLARDLGFAECYDFGGDDQIPLLEQFAMAWINLAIMQKQGRNLAFKMLRR